MRSEMGANQPEEMRCEDVVIIDEDDDIATRGAQSREARPAKAGGRLGNDAAADGGDHGIGKRFRAAVVHDEEFPFGAG